ncbi:MAG: hypothetical protein J6B93_00010 [Clostridia bacterium]|nr:hypothetical protein [Clostridia bacterium]
MKRFIAWLLILAVLMTLCACNGQGGSSSDGGSTSLPSSDIIDSSDQSSGPPPSSESDSSLAGPSSSQQGDPPDNEPDPLPPEVKPQSPHSNHYCYTVLSDRQKTYYDSMHTATENMQSGWIVLGEAGEGFRQDIAVARTALANDHPDIFWLPPYYGTATGSDGQGGTAALMLFSADAGINDSEDHKSFMILRSEKEVMSAELEAAVEAIKAKVTATDPYEIELQLHDLLCEAVTYNNDTTDPFIYTAYGALVNGKALCEGYSRAMQLLLGEFGIRAGLVTGVAGGEGHMWNVVEIGGKWYHLDVTWNDIDAESSSHAYFNLTDEVILLDHNPNEDYTRFAPGLLETGRVPFNINVPACGGREENYFVKSGFIYEEAKAEALAEYLAASTADTIEVAFDKITFKDAFIADSDKYLTEINTLLLAKHPECGFTVGGSSVAANTLRLYKQVLLPVENEANDLN